MPKYKITETRQCIQTWEFEVEAPSEDEALHLVMSAKVQPIEHFVSDDGWSTESDYEVAELPVSK